MVTECPDSGPANTRLSACEAIRIIRGIGREACVIELWVRSQHKPQPVALENEPAWERCRQNSGPSAGQNE